MFTTIDNALQGVRSDQSGTIVLNGRDLQGGIAWDPGLRRPYIENGEIWVDVTTGFKPRIDQNGQYVINSGGIVYDRVVQPQRVLERVKNGEPVLHVDNATVLPKESWIRMDAAVQQALRSRLRAWDDLRAANTLGGFDAMAYPMLERELINDPGEAKQDMDGISEDSDQLQEHYLLQGLPLPITYSGFHMSERFLRISQQAGRPANTQRAEIAGRRCGELVERQLIGTVAGLQYGVAQAGSYLQTSKIYGYTTHPARITKTDLTASASITPEGFFNAVLAMRELAYLKNFYGPFVLYTSTGYDAKLDQLFKTDTSNYPTNMTTRNQVRQIDGISDIRRLDYLTGDVLLLVQMTSDVCQAINGMEFTTVQWESKGGAQRNFKVMGIQVPYIKSAILSGAATEHTGIVHGTTAP